MLLTPRGMLASPSVCGVPLVVCVVVLLNGGSGMCCDARVRIRSGTLCCLAPSRIVQSPFSLCVCCHSIVGLGLCLCGMVVSLWNSGGGLCGAEGRVVSTVYTSSVLWCASRWCVMTVLSCLVALCCGL